MTRKQHFIFFLLFISIAGLSVPNAAAQQDELEALIGDVSADTQKGAIFGYTYQMRFSYSQHKKIGYGRKFTRLYEAIIPNRFSLKKTYRHPFLLIRDSEQQITGADIDAMRNKLVEELERAEKEAESEPDAKPRTNDGGYWTIGFSSNGKAVKINVIKLIENAKFSNLQRSEAGGRETVTIDFVPNPDSTFEPALSYLGKIAGRIWIDETDRRITRIEGFPLDSFAELKDKTEEERRRNAVFLYIQTRVAEGFWFPQDVVLNFTQTPEIFDTVRIEFSFDKYRKSSTEVRSSELETPKEVKTEVTEEKQKTEKPKTENREKD